MAERNPCICDYNTYGTHTQGCYDHQYKPQADAMRASIDARYRAEREVVRAAKAWRKAWLAGGITAETVAAIELSNAILDLEKL